MIKGRLGIMVWSGTLHDETAVKPTDLVSVSQQITEAEPSNAEIAECVTDVMAA